MRSKLLLSDLAYLIFFTGTFIYFGFLADYILFYQEKASLFVFSFDFLHENLNQPGGLLIYSGKFFSSFFYQPVLGALIVSVTLTLIVFLISGILGFFSEGKSFIIPFLFGLLLFWLQTDYRFLFYNTLGILLQLTLFSLSVRYLKAIKGWIPIIIVPVWYYITGSFAWLFSLMMIASFLSVKEKGNSIKIAGLVLLNILTLYVSKEVLFFQSGKTLLIFPFTKTNIGEQTILFLLVIVFLAVLPLLAKLSIRLHRKLKEIQRFQSAFQYSAITLLCLILLFTCLKRQDKKVGQYFHIEKLFYQNRYNEIAEFNLTHPSTNSLTIFLNNLALCETNKLNDQLFSYPQSADGNTLFLKWEMIGEILRRGGYFYYTIGMINEAHRWAFENMVMKGLSPEGLKMLIRTELINGNYTVASRYTAILKKTLFYRNEAKSFEKLLFNDAAVSSDSELGEKRKMRLKSDFFSITDDPYINIQRILATDSLNRNAFEYKMAFLMLRKDYQGIIAQLPKYSELGYTRFPVNIEEAVMAITALNNGTPPFLGKMQISQGTQARWNGYLTVFQKYGNDLKAAEPALRKQYGSTFWYYVFYR